MTQWEKLFGTPEMAANTMAGACVDCCECVISTACEYGCDDGCLLGDSGKLLEWLESEVRDD